MIKMVFMMFWGGWDFISSSGYHLDILNWMAFVIENFYESYVLLFQFSGILFLHVSNAWFFCETTVLVGLGKFCWLYLTLKYGTMDIVTLLKFLADWLFSESRHGWENGVCPLIGFCRVYRLPSISRYIRLCNQ